MPSYYLRLHGHDTTIATSSPRMDKEDWESAMPYIEAADIICFHRFIDWQYLIRKCKQMGKTTVYCTDDYFILGKENIDDIVMKTLKRGGAVKKSARLADAVIVATPALEEAFKLLNPNTYMVPNMLDYGLPQWNRRKPIRLKKKVVIGYYGSVHHYYDLLLVKHPIERLLREYPHVEFHYGTAKKKGMAKLLNPKTKTMTGVPIEHNPLYDRYMSISADMPPKRVKFLEWKDIDKYGETYRHFDIAIAPLTNAIMNPYKSNLKILEAGAYNLPIVCSDIRPFAETITHGVDGFIAKTEKDWYHYLKQLIELPELRKRMGNKLGQMTRLNYDIRTHWYEWERVFEEIGGY